MLKRHINKLKLIYLLPKKYLFSKVVDAIFSNKHKPFKSAFRLDDSADSCNHLSSTDYLNRDIQYELFLSVETIVILKKQAEKILDHQFDLLGSSEVVVDHILSAHGFEGSQYLMTPGETVANKVRERMVEVLNSESQYRLDINLLHALKHYKPIDWHVDFKSGYRWEAETWYQDVPIGDKLGVDVKVPWELSRCQHFTTLGLANLIEPENLSWGYEYALQVTDWIAANPYPYGVNWRCTMDVAIRAVNWLWGWVLFKEHPALNEKITEIFMESIYQHGQHIEKNLEFTGRGFNSNHYLANLAGFIYIGVTLPCFEESDRWLAFAIQELVEEMKYQVYDDGISYEGSTSYHRLVAEIFYSCTALVLGLGNDCRSRMKNYTHKEHRVKPRLKPYPSQEFDLDSQTVFPNWYFEKLELMAQFIYDLTKSNGKMPQFGDNDSSRLHKLTPVLNEKGEEEFNDHRHILALAGRMFSRADFTEAGQNYALDAEFLMGRVGSLPIKTGNKCGMNTTSILTGKSECSKFNERKGLVSELIFTIQPRENTAFAGKPQVFYYPHGGIAVFKNDIYYFAFTCIPAGLGGVGGHNHNEQLSFELNVLGDDFIVDGGSYVYTALPDLRNEFRSTKAHNTIFVNGKEQNPFIEGHMFTLPDRAKATLEEVSAKRFIGSHRGFGFRHTRVVVFEEQRIIIRDYLRKKCEAYFVVNLHPSLQAEFVDSDLLRLESRQATVEITGGLVNKAKLEPGCFSEQYGERKHNLKLTVPIL